MGLFGPRKPQAQLPGRGGAVAQPQPGSGGVVKGTTDRCGCPWCGKVMNFKDVEDYGLEPGAQYQCDNQQCRRFFEVVRLQPVTVLWVKGLPNGPTGFPTR